MGWGIKLTEEQWNELDRLRFTAKSADVFRNCLIILKSDSRDTIASIAEDLGCSADTVVRVRRLYRTGGIDVLKPIKPPGRPGKATPQFIAQMRRAVTTNPLVLGYGFSTWSLARLSAHLAKTTGIRLGTDQLGRLLRRHGFSFQRPKHTMKGKRDEVAYEKAKAAELIRLKKKPCERTPPKHWFFRTRSRYIATRR
jgi:transposase